MTIAERIKVLAPAIRVRELATRAGLPYTTVASLFQLGSSSTWAQDRGKRGPTIATIEALAKALGVRPAFLAFGEQPEAGGGE